MNVFKPSFSYKLIYVFRINDSTHRGLLKIGDATLHTDSEADALPPDFRELKQAAKDRINEYTGNAGIAYELLHTRLAVRSVIENGIEKRKAFRDHNVHEVLIRSGIKRHSFHEEASGREWFETDLQTVKRAIDAVISGRKSLDPNEITTGRSPIEFRPEQKKAIKETLANFKNSDRMLWNAKMRFGKTLTALQVAKEMKFQKTLIFTHRPVVNEGWYEDFNKIFYDTNYKFGSKTKGEKIENLVDTDIPFVYFASIQDLRGSEAVGGKFDKNDYIFLLDWDFVIIDEAHEGTQTTLGQRVIEAIRDNDPKKKPKFLELSGTPFNLLSGFKEGEIFTWDYIMEQRAKRDWPLYHFGDSNPYEELPKLEIYTYDLDKYIPGFIDVEDGAFNFREFFRTWTGDIKKDFKPLPSKESIGKFVHEDAVQSFLNLLTRSDENSNFPYSKEAYRSYYRHTLWMVPGVKEAYALAELLRKHPVFGSGAFKIVNVAGAGDEERDSQDALKDVLDAIGENPDDGYTITISCGRLTTGVTVKAWTAVFMLAGSFSTSAANYLQTIFRVQSPANINGRIKEFCSVFDFAPDRTLKMVAEAGNLSTKTGKTDNDRKIMGEFLNFCPVISLDGSRMVPYNVDNMLQQLKRAYTDRVVRNGFDDRHIYNDNLLKLDDIALEDFERLKKIIGSTKQAQKPKDVDINRQGFTDEEYEELKRIERKPKKERTPEEEALLAEKKKKRDNAQKAMSILRGISIRIPLLIYGAEVPIDQDITVDNFVDLIDDASWDEFMPTGVTKPVYKKFAKYYEQDVFVAAGRQIRKMAQAADELAPTERVQKIAQIFSQFKNPDKETVLTPWRVVNMHMSECLGGYNFFNEDFTDTLDDPVFVDRGKVTEDTLCNPNVHILEINSKTGLYPLYVTYSLFRSKIDKIPLNEQTADTVWDLWTQTVAENVFVICKTPMAKAITKRTLLGYKPGKVNAHYFEDLINQLKNKPDQFKEKITRGSYWGRKESVMKFDAVVGNPPYQGTNHSQIYPFFYLAAIEIGKYVSLIFPSGWQQPKNANNLVKLNNEKIKTDSQIVKIDNRQNIFPNISGAEWVNIILWECGFNNGLNGKQLLYTNGENPQILKLCWEVNQSSKPEEIQKFAQIILSTQGFVSLQKYTSVSKPYGIRKDIFKNYAKYNLPEMSIVRQSKTDILVYGSFNEVRYVPRDYAFPRRTKALEKFKVLVGSAWGNMSEKTGLGGAYANVIVAKPFEACTETYQESGCFDDIETCIKHAKYLMTKFARAALYVNKISQMSTTSWGAVPVQDYSEAWWNNSIDEIDEQLFIKYNIPENIRRYIRKNIQRKTEENIIIRHE